MEFSQLVQDRCAVQQFSTMPVQDSEVEAILKAARLAPTAASRQPHRILVLRSQESMDKLRECTAYRFDAPMALALCCKRDQGWEPHDHISSGPVNAAIVGAHIMLAAHDLGLGTTWVGHFDPHRFRQAFMLPCNLDPVAIFPIGHPAAEARPALHRKGRTLDHTMVHKRF